MAASCAQDRVLPVSQVCGDGEVVGTERCDSDSEGCVWCQIRAGWQCPDNDCSEICGDLQIVGEEDCDPPDGLACDDSCRTANKTAACDMSGYWLARQTDFSRDTLVSALQPSSSWYVYHLRQEGDLFSVQKSLYCSVEVSGTVTVRPRPSGDRALLYSNAQDGSTGRPPRSGVFKENGDLCDFSFERMYIIRGLEQSYLPEDFRAKPDLDDILPPMPVPGDQLVLDDAYQPGTVDLDGDGRPGFAWQITGVASGVRHAVQRDWTEATTDADMWPIPTYAIEFTTRSVFDANEVILFIEDCGETCAFLKTSGFPSQSEKSRTTFRYLGTELSDPRVAAVVEGSLYENEAVDMATCENVRKAMPHDPMPEEEM